MAVYFIALRILNFAFNTFPLVLATGCSILSLCPHQDSNLATGIRNPALYPPELWGRPAKNFMIIRVFPFAVNTIANSARDAKTKSVSTVLSL